MVDVKLTDLHPFACEINVGRILALILIHVRNE
jgi:hypothetical protein